MPRVVCRCGHTLKVSPDGPERVDCPKCSARIRVRRASPQAADADPYIRFPCPCGRRLKVRNEGTPQAGKCPDCGRIVPVPASARVPVTSSSSSSSTAGPSPMAGSSRPEASTEEMSAVDLDMLDEWTKIHLDRASASPSPAVSRIEAGLRVCPRCGRPVHLGAVACRECGAHVPKR